MIVIKYGGHALDGSMVSDSIIETISKYHLDGGRVVVVHGGGPAINAELAIHNVQTTMSSGYRVTTLDVMHVVQETLSGSVLRNLTNKFISFGVNAVGISSGDGGILRARRFQPMVDGVRTDIGLVGEAESTDPTLLNLLLDHGYLPLISPVGVQSDGTALNINADIAAGSIAGSLGAREILFITDVAGIYRNWPDPDSLISQISLEELEKIAPSFSDGMAPKSKAAITALSSGAKMARIIDGSNKSNLEKAFAGFGGTVVTT